MKKTKCFKCEGESFELTEVLPINSEAKAVLIQCAECGTAVGAIDQYDVGSLVKQIANHLGISIH